MLSVQRSCFAYSSILSVLVLQAAILASALASRPLEQVVVASGHPSEEFRHYSYSDHGDYHGGGDSHVVTRVRYVEPRTKTRVKVITKKRRVRPTIVRAREAGPVIPVHETAVAPVHPVSGVEGSYVAVAGDPTRGSVHVVENVPALGHDSVTVVNGVRVRNRPVVTALVPRTVAVPAPVPLPERVPVAVPVPVPAQAPAFPQIPIPDVPKGSAANGVPGDRLPLPKCSYVNTDFPGDTLLFNDGATNSLNAGSARGCKALCRLEADCSFWTYKEGFNRNTDEPDCYLKIGTPGLPVPREAVPRIGFVSGTKDNNCVCIMSDDEEDEVCPIKDPKGLVYPWRSTDQEEDDISRGLLPSGWRPRNGNPYDPFSTYFPGVGFEPGLGVDGGLNGFGGASRGALEDDLRSLRAQLDLITRRLQQTL